MTRTFRQNTDKKVISLIFLKRYGIPPIIAVCLYSFMYFLFGRDTHFFNIGIVFCLLFSYLIRVSDDICDHKKDVEARKAPLNIKALVTLECIVLIAVILLSVIFRFWMMLVPTAVIMAQFAIKERHRNCIKPFFLPSIVITLVYSMFEGNCWLYVVVVVLTAVDVILIIRKR